MSLNENTITFGKYKNGTLERMLRDRKYCEWLLQQDWFMTQYEYLYNRVKEYNPVKMFFSRETKSRNEVTGAKQESETTEAKPAHPEDETKKIKEYDPIDPTDFVNEYKYFNLISSSKLKDKLNSQDLVCYKFYRKCIKKLRNKIEFNEEINPYKIKAPTRWLKEFESETGLNREVLKEFLYAHDLPNITSIVEEIKKVGGIEYKGAKSFLIAKERSLQQEGYWEKILKEKYGEDIGSQFKYEKCIFDFICIKNNTVYECKLALKDFNEEQHRKYLIVLGTYSIVYLIGNDTVIDVDKHTIFTINTDYYEHYTRNVENMPKATKFDKLIQRFRIEKIKDVESIKNIL